jgi:hypothetical protein
MQTVEPQQLSELERVLLTVLAAGLAPSALAGNPSFRLDVLCARTLALLRREPAQTYLASEAEARPDFQRWLSAAVHSLTDRRILVAGGESSSAYVPIEGEPEPVGLSHELVDFNVFPAVFERHLAGRCLDELLRDPEVYRFIMDKYAESTEIWQRAARQGL